MDNTGVSIKKSYAFTYKEWLGGHISLTADSRAILVHSRNTKNQLECKVFTASPEETAEAQAKRYVLENIDEKANFFEDPFLDLYNWLLLNT